MNSNIFAQQTRRMTWLLGISFFNSRFQWNIRHMIFFNFFYFFHFFLNSVIKEYATKFGKKKHFIWLTFRCCWNLSTCYQQEKKIPLLLLDWRAWNTKTKLHSILSESFYVYANLCIFFFISVYIYRFLYNTIICLNTAIFSIVLREMRIQFSYNNNNNNRIEIWFVSIHGIIWISKWKWTFRLATSNVCQSVFEIETQFPGGTKSTKSVDMKRENRQNRIFADFECQKLLSNVLIFPPQSTTHFWTLTIDTKLDP